MVSGIILLSFSNGFNFNVYFVVETVCQVNDYRLLGASGLKVKCIMASFNVFVNSTFFFSTEEQNWKQHGKDGVEEVKSSVVQSISDDEQDYVKVSLHLYL